MGMRRATALQLGLGLEHLPPCVIGADREIVGGDDGV